MADLVRAGDYQMVAEETCKGGGDTMATCLCALQLMVYYRYLPTSSKEARGVSAKPKPEPPKEEKLDVDIEVDI